MIRARRLASIAVLVVVLGAPASAQRSIAPASSHPYQPGIDVLDYDVRLELPDTGSFIRAEVTVTALRSPETDTLRLDLVPTLTVRETTVNDVPQQPVRDGATVRVPLGALRNDTVRVRVRYDGNVTDGLIVQRDRRGRWTWFGDNWPDRARHWLATVDHPSDKATVSFTVRAPSARTIVANGASLGVRPLGGADAGRSETRWRESRPIATYLMVIGAGPMHATRIEKGGCVVSAMHRCVEQTVYAMAEHDGYLPGPFAAAPAIVSYFEEIAGPFPYEKLAHLQSATRFGGMENASAIFYADRLFPERSLGEGLIAHETAHQWFGDAVTEREWAHLWLSEGFATYLAALWTRRSQGEAAFLKQMGEIRSQILADTVVAARPVLDTLQRDYLALLNANSYQKGGYVLYMLHQQLGDSAFFAGLRAYYMHHRDGTALSDDLRRELEAASGQRLDVFFDQWLRRPGVAMAQAGWAWDASSGKVAVTVLQPGPALPYALTLPVRIMDATGQVTQTTIAVPQEARASVTLPGSFAARPRSVVVDADRVALARLVRL